MHTDGGMREQFVVPAAKLHPSARLTLDQLVLVETLGIGCHAVDRAPFAGAVDEFAAWTRPEPGVIKAMIEV